MTSHGQSGRDTDPPPQHAIHYAGREIAYSLRRSARRRSVGLTIEPDGSVHVAAPPRMPLAVIAAFVQTKAAWIIKHQLRLASLASTKEQHERHFLEGDKVPLLDEQLTLHFVPPYSGVPPHVTRDGSALLVRGIPPEHADTAARRAAVRRAVEAWYKAEAHNYFTLTCALFAAQLGLPPPPVGIGDAQRRWGSCSSRGSIRLTWRLLLAPQAVADYVAAHEVAHLLELNHSLRFWRVLAKLLPDFKARERRLEELAATLVL